MEPLIERLNRWAENLPPSETIPILDIEAFELAEWEDSQYGTQDSSRVHRVLDAIANGRFIFRGHRIVVM